MEARNAKVTQSCAKVTQDGGELAQSLCIQKENEWSKVFSDIPFLRASMRKEFSHDWKSTSSALLGPVTVKKKIRKNKNFGMLFCINTDFCFLTPKGRMRRFKETELIIYRSCLRIAIPENYSRRLLFNHLGPNDFSRSNVEQKAGFCVWA